jgi:hypothetical protein
MTDSATTPFGPDLATGVPVSKSDDGAMLKGTIAQSPIAAVERSCWWPSFTGISKR